MFGSMLSSLHSCYPAWMYRALVMVFFACPGLALAQDDGTARLEQDLERLDDAIGTAPSRLHHERADVLFRLGRFEDAIRDYDLAAEFGQPHDEDSCWERGLAQYYAGDFAAGAEQFERYHRVGPLDIENGLWRFLCIAETDGIEKARDTMLGYPRRVRAPFPALLDLYLGKGDVNAVLTQATEDNSSGEDATRRLFNAHYYLAKYYEITGDRVRALEHVRKSLEYRIPHFMYYCAEIDAQRLKADLPAEGRADQQE